MEMETSNKKNDYEPTNPYNLICKYRNGFLNVSDDVKYGTTLAFVELNEDKAREFTAIFIDKNKYPLTKEDIDSLQKRVQEFEKKYNIKSFYDYE